MASGGRGWSKTHLQVLPHSDRCDHHHANFILISGAQWNRRHIRVVIQRALDGAQIGIIASSTWHRARECVPEFELDPTFLHLALLEFLQRRTHTHHKSNTQSLTIALSISPQEPKLCLVLLCLASEFPHRNPSFITSEDPVPIRSATSSCLPITH